jgi:K+/H+ antiporter YhaU regulatory subunit KhtT
LAPHELLLQTCDYIGQSISQLNFWQTTGATIVAILHNDELVLSPGPYAILEKNDTIYFVGNETIFQNVKTFLSSLD